MIFIRIFVFALGALIVIAALRSAIVTFVLPRSAADKVALFVFRTIRRVFNLRARYTTTYAERDSIMAAYAPVSLIALLLFWLLLVLVGYMLMFWATDNEPWSAAFKVSGSSLLTLGFSQVETMPTIVLSFTEAALGLILIALLIAYLPTMYGAFSQREEAVTLLEVRAGAPPSAIELIKRFHRLDRLDKLSDLWVSWEEWFAVLEESHTSLAALTFFRSSQPDHSWVTAAGAVLDGAAMTLAAVDIPHDAQADLCIRAGYLALQRIASYFNIAYNPTPRPDDPISIAQAEFYAAYDELAVAVVPLKPDREAAWRAFCGWRVNYDSVLLGLAQLTMAPYAPWSSDRSFSLEQQERMKQRIKTAAALERANEVVE